ncbi:MAG: hypothetical protein KDJ17_02360 [Hyphomicrobiaceae bacterium]|nr:hypothetical protein [Hyphomicrobiaceae bacterium]
MKEIIVIAAALAFATPALAAPDLSRAPEAQVVAPYHLTQQTAQAPAKQAKTALSSMAGTDLSEYHRHLA